MNLFLYGTSIVHHFLFVKRECLCLVSSESGETLLLRDRVAFGFVWDWSNWHVTERLYSRHFGLRVYLLRIARVCWFIASQYRLGLVCGIHGETLEISILLLILTFLNTASVKLFSGRLHNKLKTFFIFFVPNRVLKLPILRSMMWQCSLRLCQMMRR